MSSKSSRSFTIIDDKAGTGQTALVLGSSFTGKTSLLVIALNNLVRNKSYDVIVVFTESINSEPLKKLKYRDHRVIFANCFLPDVIKWAHLINQETENRYKFLFILDDIVDMGRKKVYQKIILTMRNSNISSITVTQYSKLIPPALRGSYHNVIFTGFRSSESREFVIKNWLTSPMKELGMKKMEQFDKFFVDSTKYDPNDKKNGKYIWLDNIREDMHIETRPYLK